MYPRTESRTKSQVNLPSIKGLLVWLTVVMGTFLKKYFLPIWSYWIFIRIIHEHNLERKNLGLSWKLVAAPLLMSLFLILHATTFSWLVLICFRLPNNMLVLRFLIFNFRYYLLMSFIHVYTHTHTPSPLPHPLSIFLCHYCD